MTLSIRLLGLTQSFAWFCTCLILPVSAQITPDGTLPNNSIVTSDGQTFTIKGGTTSGNNLLHSFKDFSLPTGNVAAFENALIIQNIIGRITGGNLSNIDGLIRANSSANLFLINPNGFVFGPNASLNIGGSFVASTASSMKFADGTEFSATDLSQPPVLTVSVPVGLGFGGNRATIKIENEGHTLSASTTFFPTSRANTPIGLSVKPGKTLALIGGDLIFEGGLLTAEEGRVELSSVDSGWVSINFLPQGLILGYEGVTTFKNIELSKESFIEVTGQGSVQIQANRAKIADGSIILNQNRQSQPSGNIEVNASSLEIVGLSSDQGNPSSLRSEATKTGTGANININTRRLLLKDGAGIRTRTYDEASSGNVTVNATEAIEVLGFAPSNSTLTSSISAITVSSGPAGNVLISTGKLFASSGGFIRSSTLGTGLGGNLRIDADLVEVNGTSGSAISSLSVAAFNNGNAGNLEINTSKLILTNGASAIATSIGTGSAGSVTINATNLIEVKGFSEISVSRIGTEIIPGNDAARNRFGSPELPRGNAGSVSIKTGRLNLLDRGRITVVNNGLGNAGTLTVKADSISLNNQATIIATTRSGQGGNISLFTNNLQANDSQISATAGGGGNGGNIQINSRFVTNDNSPISANAFLGQGGNIQINAEGVFTRNSPITASSELGVDGTIEIETYYSQIFVSDPTEEFDSVENVIARSCLSRFGQSGQSHGSFTNAGSGGLPSNPYSRVDSGFDLIEIPSPSESTSSNQVEESEKREPAPFSSAPSTSIANEQFVVSIPEAKWQMGDPVNEGTALVKMTDGRVLLVSEPPEQPYELLSVFCN